MENKKLYALLFLSILFINLSSASSFLFKQNTEPDLKINCFDIDSNLCNDQTICYLTLHYPDLDNLYADAVMTYNESYFNKTLANLNKTGEYPGILRCVGNTTGYSTFTIEVTPTGQSQLSILQNPVLLLFSLIGLILLILGVYMANPGMGFLGSIMFILGGIYTMIFGLNNVTDFYTRGIGGTLIGLGFIIMFVSAYEWMRKE